MNKTSVTVQIDNVPLTIEVGALAQQATSSVLARLGDTMILATVVEGTVREDLGYFPLSVEYVERLYAGGRIKGSRWVKREGRPSDDAVLTGRLIDRSIRPLFPKEYKNEVQIVVTVLSVDGENEPDILSMIAVSAALHISKIPWNGPIAATRIGLVKERNNGGIEYLINPGRLEIELSELDMVVSQSKDKTLMLEAGARQVAEEHILKGIQKAHEVNRKIIAFIEELAKKVGQKKAEVSVNTHFSELVSRMEKTYREDITALIPSRASKEGEGGEQEELITRILENEKMERIEEPIDKKIIGKALEYLMFKIIKEQVVKKKKRPDGRKVDDIRPISVGVSVLPRTHGSALFQRGSTQALTVATLGSPRMEQLIESAEGEEAKRYIHHYSMPPYSVGETGRMGVPSRREIGHGALAERALLGVMPKENTFPYTIRVVSEILSSNGSTSMASTCGSTLALMDAGVPILSPVSGIAMGMMSLPSSGQAKKDDYVILSDIIGLEDFSGDMDFKVAGTADGVTAIQLDVKIPGLTDQQIIEIFEQAKIGRMYILDKMLEALPEPRRHVSEYAPKIEQVRIPPEKIGEVIGPGGRIIRNIMAETGATIDVEDDGTVTVSGTSEESVTKAATWIAGLTRELQVGEEFEGTVKRILPFGAFVEVLPNKEGMVHVSHMSKDFVRDPNDVVQIGQKVRVRVIEIDEQGRVNLSMLFGQDAEEKEREKTQNRRPPQGGGMANANPHPLTMQFRRERNTQPGGWQKKGPRRPRFRPER